MAMVNFKKLHLIERPLYTEQCIVGLLSIQIYAVSKTQLHSSDV